VHATDRLLAFWSGNDLLRTTIRGSKRRSGKKRAAGPRTVLTRRSRMRILASGWGRSSLLVNILGTVKPYG